MDQQKPFVSRRTCPHCFGALLGLIVCVLTVIFSGDRAEAQTPKRKGKIGVIVALSGPVASVGQSIQNSISIAREKFDPNSELEFLFEDDQFQAKFAVTAAEKLINQDKVDALITFSGATSAAVSEVAERRKMPLVAITAIPTLGKGKSYVYTLYMAAEQQMELLTSAVKNAGFHRLGVVTTVQDAVLGFRKIFVSKNSALVVRDEEVLPGDANVSSVVTRVQSQKPDAVILFTLPPQVSILSRQLRDQGFTGQFLGGPPLYNPPEIQASKGALSGAWIPGPSTESAGEFLARYEQKFHETCISEGFYGYDSAVLLMEALRSGNIREHLEKTKSFTGISGTYPKNELNVFEVPAELKVITEDGKLRKK